MAKSTMTIAASISSAMLALFAGAAAADYGDPCTIVGTPGADELIGTDGNDFICGLGGDDYIDGAGGDDRIDGGEGNDLLLGNDGNDFVLGGMGDDTIDTRDGVRGNDFASAFAGSDTCLIDRRRGARPGDRVDQCESVR